MTEFLRRKAAERFRTLLDSGTHRKNAIKQVCDEYECDRASLYRWCKRFNVSTK